MKKIILLNSLALAFLIFTCGSALALPTTVDGNLSDWGVSVFADMTPDLGVLYNIENYPLADRPSGGELYDAEAIYSYRDSYNDLWFAIVTSFPSTGFGYNSITNIASYIPGDLAISMDSLGAGTGEYGYEYGFALTDVQPLTLENHNVTPGTLYSVTDWAEGTVLPDNSPTYIVSGSAVSTGQVSYVNAGVTENGFDTWIIEGVISGLPWSNVDGNNAFLHWTQSCGNDAIDLNPVPEPSTMLLFGIGLAGLAGGIKRKMVR